MSWPEIHLAIPVVDTHTTPDSQYIAFPAGPFASCSVQGRAAWSWQRHLVLAETLGPGRGTCPGIRVGRHAQLQMRNEGIPRVKVGESYGAAAGAADRKGPVLPEASLTVAAPDLGGLVACSTSPIDRLSSDVISRRLRRANPSRAFGLRAVGGGNLAQHVGPRARYQAFGLRFRQGAGAWTHPEPEGERGGGGRCAAQSQAVGVAAGRTSSPVTRERLLQRRLTGCS